MSGLLTTLFIGIGATAVMDLWALVRRPLLRIARPNYAMVGRWIGHMVHGRFRHNAIAASPPVPGEHIVGWAAHYLIGVAFAALLIAVAGIDWVQHPTIGPALAVGVGTVAAPFLLMQPGMGNGIAASRAPCPASARLHSIVTHTVFGIGLYAAGWLLHVLLHS